MRAAPVGLFVLAGLAAAAEVSINEKPENQQQCQGMYSRKSWGGSVDPFILTTFMAYRSTGPDDPNTDPILSAVIFEYSDHNLLGVPKSPESSEMQYVCDQEAIEAEHCSTDDVGKFILKANATDRAKAAIRTEAIHLAYDNRTAINYPILKTGYYCVSVVGFGDFHYAAVTEFRNAYGELPGSQIAKLPFYGGLAIVYAVVVAFWAFLYVQNRHDILAVQNYITATLGFLVVEMISTWGYYDHMNRNGSDFGSKVLVLIVAILNALRNSLSFFLLLIVCMGYGVVHASLGKKMTWARVLGATHFVFGVIYAIASLSITPEDAGPLVLLVVLPLAATLTAFYVWTLNALGITMKDLMERKQNVKAQMYRQLWWCILGSVIVIFAFFFLNSFTFAGQGDPDFTPGHWQTRWFVLDGWLNVVYLADVVFIAYLWRPTANNRRFAMSQEVGQPKIFEANIKLSQDDEGFEISSLNGSDDEDDLEAKPTKRENGAVNGAAANGNGLAVPEATDSATAAARRAESPLPAPKPTRPRPDNESETLFAVGNEDDAGSDEDDDGNVAAGKRRAQGAN